MLIPISFIDARGRKVRRPKRAPILWRISAYTMVFHGGKILTVIPTWNTLFELPGGEAHVKESIITAAERECYEETGFRVRIHDNLPIHFGEEWFYSWPKKTFYHSTFFVFVAKLITKRQDLSVINTKDGNEIANVQWVDPRTCTKKNTHRIVYPAIQHVTRLIKIKDHQLKRWWLLSCR